MAETINESTIRKFVHRVFRKSNDIGALTVKSVREEFLKHLGIERLETDQKELFKTIVHDVYNLYVNKNQDQGSEEEDSQTTTTQSDDDTTASSTSTSPRKKKRRIESDNESDKEAPHSEDITNNNNKILKKEPKESNGIKKQRSKEVDRNIETSDVDSDKNEQDKQDASKIQTLQEIEHDDASSVEEQQKKKKSSKSKNAEKIDTKRKSIESSSEEEEQQEEESKERKIHDDDEEEEFVDSRGSESMNEEERHSPSKKKTKSKSNSKNLSEEVDDTQKKKLKKKSKATDKKKSSPPAEDSAKLRNLKRYARTCGMHLKYVDIFADCKSMSQKERMLDKLIRDRTGLEGRITLKMCQKYKKKKEEADEVAELDCNNIITTDDGRRRPTRSTRTGSDNRPPPSTVPNTDGAIVFSRLKGVVDSDDSYSEDEKTSRKQTIKTSTDRENSHENIKKRRRVDSSSDGDDY